MDKLVSMIMPVYNTGERLIPCLDSALAQTYKNIEIIIIDDGSEDEKTREILRKYAEENEQIRLFTVSNAGGSSARNKGLEKATGEYICWADSDDILAPDFVETLYQGMETGELSICGFKEVKGDVIINETTGSKQVVSAKDAMTMLLREDSFKGYVWNKMFRRDIIEKMKLRFDVNIDVWEDVLFDFTYMTMIQQVTYHPKPVYTYIYWEDSLSHAKNHVLGVKRSYSALEAELRMEEMLTGDGDQELRRQMSIRYVQSALAVIRNVGYQRAGTKDEYYRKSLMLLKKHKKTAMPYLSKKDKFLANICCVCPGLLLLLYRFR